MSIPTVAVTCTAFDQSGNSVAGAVYTAKLDQTEIYDGFVVPEQITVTADANGVAILHLWPNALGANGSSYRITARNPDTGRKFFDASVVVPNSPCNLYQIIQSAPFPNVDSAQQALIDVQAQVAIANQDVLLILDHRGSAELAAAQALTRSAAAALSEYNASLSEQGAEAASALIQASTKAGSFVCAALAQTTVSDPAVLSTDSKIMLTPMNASAAALMGGGTHLYVSGKTANTGFVVTTANGLAATGGELFDYIIVN